MNRLLLAALLVLAPAITRAADAPKAADPKAKPAAPAANPNDGFKTDEERTLYALGLVIGKQLGQFSLSPAEFETVKKGIGDSFGGAKPKLELETWGPKIQELAKARATVAADKEKAKSKEFQDKMAKEKGAVKEKSGLIIIPMKAGTGEMPKATDTVKVHYHGTLPDGTVFDSSVKRGEPATFPLNGVIPCWTEGVQKMKVGEKAKLICPSDIAYGDRGHPPTIPGGATLVFEVELLSIEAPKK